MDTVDSESVMRYNQQRIQIEQDQRQLLDRKQSSILPPVNGSRAIDQYYYNQRDSQRTAPPIGVTLGSLTSGESGNADDAGTNGYIFRGSNSVRNESSFRSSGISGNDQNAIVPISAKTAFIVLQFSVIVDSRS